jgi:alkanesulfonate monooxygenase SsuD/methylene tetrahydromethanopterin reductase-like flavin-dependent oxidoreductase (luciferase family)
MLITVRAAAANAGRGPASIKFCVAVPVYIATDRAHMRDQCRWFGGRVGINVPIPVPVAYHSFGGINLGFPQHD